MRPFLFSSSVRTSFIWSSGKVEMWDRHSSVAAKSFKMSGSISNSWDGVLIARAHIDLIGVVILIETPYYGDLYSMTFYENRTALVISYLSKWKRGEERRPGIVGRFFGS